ncbi:MAG: branched-chain amino acid ABC transporter substrate-binding protein [Propionibacteriaceae bacterium]|jgi:branched-chain amino acid transport system substrate-binding protein|nr:branched-chain amino acid ABC transporter substrate-binding protein [Propionibacteriaceae bacterium]
MTKNSLVQRLVLATAILSTLALTACSGGVGGDQNGPNDEGPIRIGMLAPLTGSESVYGTYLRNGAEMAVEEINAQGGLLGRPVELVVEDDGCDAQMATAGATKLVSAGIHLAVGGYCSGSTLPTEQIFYSNGIPQVITAANGSQLIEAGLDSVFLVNGLATQQAQSAVKFAQKQGAQAIFTVDDGDAYPKGLTDAFAEYGQPAGLNIVAHEQINKAEKDFGSVATAIVGSGADFVFCTAYVQPCALLNQQAKQYGFSGDFLIGDGAVDAQFADLTGAAYVERVYGTFTQTPDMLVGAEQWLASYQAKFGAEPGPYTTQAYDGVRVMAEGVRLAGSTDRQAVADAIHGLRGFDLFSGPATFTDQGVLADSSFVIVVLKDGKFVLFDDLKS